MKKFFRIVLFTLLGLVLAMVLYILITFPPVMAGMAAKTVCSCVFVTGRDLQSIREKELQVFPGLSKAGITVSDSSVSATVLWKTSKAIYRKGLGCTLLAERSEEEVRSQQIIRRRASSANQDSIEWPLGDIIRDTADTSINSDLIQTALNGAFEEIDPEHPLNTHAVVIVYDNKIVGERYASGFNRNSKFMGWSMTKSITNALVGVLVNDGRLEVQQRAPVAEWQNDERRKITLNNLLQASSGLSWTESYFSPTADFHQMFIKRDDKAGYAVSRDLVHEPGTYFQYSSGSSNIISRIIRQTVGDTAYYRFPYEKIFYPIGMNHAIIEPDASGTFVASSYSFASARDWARFGLLYLNDGVCNGKRILPEGWVKYSMTPALSAGMGRYGAHWWLNAGDPANTKNRKYPELPEDAYWADGFEEQYVMVIPSKKLVIVRLGVSHNGFDISKLVLNVIAALPNENINYTTN